jgi:hypothetical protein
MIVNAAGAEVRRREQIARTEHDGELIIDESGGLGQVIAPSGCGVGDVYQARSLLHDVTLPAVAPHV